MQSTTLGKTCPPHQSRSFVLPNLVGACAVALVAATGSAQCPIGWNTAIGNPGVGNSPPIAECAASELDGDVLIGGVFTSVGGVSLNRIARWNGTSWSGLGAGLDAAPQSLLVLPDGSVVAGGFYSPSLAASVVRWDGCSWQALGSTWSSGNVVRALARETSGTILAGGSFSGVGYSSIARWNGSTWTSLGVGSGMGGAIEALLVMPNGDIIAGGSFTTAGSQPANRIARWDGTQWHALGDGSQATVYALALAPNGDLIAGGRFFLPPFPGAPSSYYSIVARWDGVAWSHVGFSSPTSPAGSSQVNSLDVDDAGEVRAGGRFPSMVFGYSGQSTFAHFDGVTWAPVAGQPSGVGSFIDVRGSARRSSSGEIILVGSFTSAGATTANGVALISPGTAGPTITQQPVATTISPGANTFFSVLAVDGTGGTSLGYQWYKDSLPISLASNPTANSRDLLLYSVQAASAGEYSCVVSTPCGSVASTGATLSVNDGRCVLDFNGDGVFPDNQDLTDFLLVLSGGACP